MGVSHADPRDDARVDPPDAPRRIRWTRRLRARFVVASVLLVAVALAVVVIVTRQTLLDRIDREIDEALVQEIEELRLLADGTNPDTAEPFGDDAAAILDVFIRRNLPATNEAFYAFVDGRPTLTSFGAPASLLANDELVERWANLTEPLRLDVTTADGDARTLAVPLSRDEGGVAGVFMVAFFPAPEFDEAAQTVRVLLVTAAVAVLVAVIVAWSAAGGVVRPVRQLTAAARDVSERDLSRRIPVDGDDELAELGHTFNDMVDRLEAGFTAQRRFLDDVAHELRTPITIARGHLELVGDVPPDARETLELVDDELEQMGRYVADLLVLAKSEQPDFLRPELVDLGEVVDDVLASVDALAERRWTRDDRTAPGTALTLADPGRIRQALVNLVTNAVQHTDDGDEIALGLDLTDGVARLHVRDTGPGVDPDVASALFRRTSRGAASRVRRPDGTGIGLSIVDAIARAHGGTVRVDRDRTPGATFVIEIPIALDPPTDEIDAIGPASESVAGLPTHHPPSDHHGDETRP